MDRMKRLATIELCTSLGSASGLQTNRATAFRKSFRRPRNPASTTKVTNAPVGSCLSVAAKYFLPSLVFVKADMTPGNGALLHDGAPSLSEVHLDGLQHAEFPAAYLVTLPTVNPLLLVLITEPHRFV